MLEINNVLLDRAKELLKNKPENSCFDDVDYLKYHLHIGMVKAGQIIELLKKEPVRLVNLDDLLLSINAAFDSKTAKTVTEYLKDYPTVQPEETIEMVSYDGEPVPKELCTVGRDGIPDDFLGCGNCFETEGADCEGCIVDKLFKSYAKLTGQEATE